MSARPASRRRTARRILVAAGAVLVLGVLGGVTANRDREPQVVHGHSETVVLRPVTIGPAELLVALLVVAAVVGVALVVVRAIHRR